MCLELLMTTQRLFLFRMLITAILSLSNLASHHVAMGSAKGGDFPTFWDWQVVCYSIMADDNTLEQISPFARQQLAEMVEIVSINITV